MIKIYAWTNPTRRKEDFPFEIEEEVAYVRITLPDVYSAAMFCKRYGRQFLIRGAWDEERRVLLPWEKWLG